MTLQGTQHSVLHARMHLSIEMAHPYTCSTDQDTVETYWYIKTDLGEEEK